MLSDFLLMFFGFILLGVGGEVLVRGAVRVAQEYSVSEYLIGTVLIGFGSSMPELVTSLNAALSGSSGIAIGNIIGSNIANILLVVGLAALIWPIDLHGKAFWKDGLWLFGVFAVFVGIANTISLIPIVGAALLSALLLYLYAIHKREFNGTRLGTKNVSDSQPAETDRAESIIHSSVPVALLGLLVLIVGAKFIVDGAVGVATQLGISEAVIGLTIVAVGTTLPEIYTGLVAAFHKHTEVVLGTVVGSCIYNILAVGGVIALATPTVMPARIAEFDSFVMLATSALLLFFSSQREKINRCNAVLMLAAYAGYILILWPR